MCSANSYAWPAQRMEGFTFAPSDIITISLNSSGELQFKKNGQSTGKVLSGFGDLRQVTTRFVINHQLYPVATVQRAQITLLDKYV